MKALYKFHSLHKKLRHRHNYYSKKGIKSEHHILVQVTNSAHNSLLWHASYSKLSSNSQSLSIHTPLRLYSCISSLTCQHLEWWIYPVGRNALWCSWAHGLMSFHNVASWSTSADQHLFCSDMKPNNEILLLLPGEGFFSTALLLYTDPTRFITIWSHSVVQITTTSKVYIHVSPSYNRTRSLHKRS
jgi:hypothetical protein